MRTTVETDYDIKREREAVKGLVKSKKIDISEYVPGRFAYLMGESFALEAWDYLSEPSRVERMIHATRRGAPAIEPLLQELETEFAHVLKSESYPPQEITVFFNNMIKQLMEMHGFVHAACGLCPGGRYFRSSGMFKTVGMN